MSPTETGTHSNNFSIVPFAPAAFTAATSTPAFNPNATAAPGSASSTYQHSVLPRVSPNLCAHASSGCTCTESFSAGNNNFTSSGNSPPNSVATEASVRPASGPVSTTHCGPVNQASPTSSVVPVSAYHGRRSRFPHGRSLNHGFNRNGATLVRIIYFLKLFFLSLQ